MFYLVHVNEFNASDLEDVCAELGWTVTRRAFVCTCRRTSVIVETFRPNYREFAKALKRKGELRFYHFCNLGMMQTTAASPVYAVCCAAA